MIGVEINDNAVDQCKNLGPQAYAVYSLRWSECEPERGSIQWQPRDDDNLAHLRGWPVILKVKNSPEWARRNPAAECSAPTDALDYADFVKRAVLRYKPWAVAVWNEADISAEQALEMGVAHFLGGFGTALARFYMRCTAAVYNAVHPIGTKVISGEMAGVGWFWRLARMTWKGYYDYVSFHRYAGWWPQQAGVVGEAACKLRRMGTQEPLICTETNFIKPADGLYVGDFQADQAEYLEHLFRTYRAMGVVGVIVFAGTSGWRGADLFRNPEATQAFVAATGG